MVLWLQEWGDVKVLDRADSAAVAAVHDAALVHVLVTLQHLCFMILLSISIVCCFQELNSDKDVHASCIALLYVSVWSCAVVHAAPQVA